LTLWRDTGFLDRGADSELRRWGLKLAERGGRNGKKRAIIATSRKLAVLLNNARERRLFAYPGITCDNAI
jgi:hypothetical protein